MKYDGALYKDQIEEIAKGTSLGSELMLLT